MGFAVQLARFDGRVVDGGVELAAAIGRWISRLFAGPGEVSIDALVERIARATSAIAHASGAVDEHGVDGAVEGTAAGVSRAGSLIRLLQTGLSHHYYLMVAIGVLLAVAVALLWSR